MLFSGKQRPVQRIPNDSTASRIRSGVKEKKVLVLGDDLGIYTINKPASYFLNWNLSKKILQEPDYFENVIFVQDSFEKDKPDVIIDEKGLMEKFFARLPEVNAQYEKTGFIYLRKP